MTIIVTHGNLFHGAPPVEALVNPVNCVGTMGAGLALAFKYKYPQAADAYGDACARGEVVPGKVFTFVVARDVHRLGQRRVIFHFPTKRHYRNRSRIEDIESGLVSLVEAIRGHGVKSISIPALGCGLGGLSWNDVKPRILKAMEPLDDVRAFVYEPE